MKNNNYCCSNLSEVVQYQNSKQNQGTTHKRANSKRLWCFAQMYQGWVKTGFSQDKTIQDRDKILKFETRKNRDSHFAVKTRREFQAVKNFSSRQVKKISFSKISRQDKTRQDSCQEKSRKIQEKFKKNFISS